MIILHLARASARDRVALLVSACSSASAADPPPPGAGGELQATTWVLHSYDSPAR